MVDRDIFGDNDIENDALGLGEIDLLIHVEPFTPDFDHGLTAYGKELASHLEDDVKKE